MSKYLMLINIGPVQDFIATARRSRDLWFGSWFLSEISKEAARVIGAEQLVFPAATDEQLKPNTNFNAANKILAVIDKNPQSVGEEIKAAIEIRLAIIRKDAFENINSDDFNGELAEEQIDDLIEFYWAAVEYDGSDENYEKARKKVEYLTAARKNTRNFQAAGWGANIPKSSLDGKRESVIYKATRRMRSDELYNKFKVRENEQLCGVGLLKRLGAAKDENNMRMDRFASTAHIAAKPFLKNLRNKTAFDSFKNSLIELGVDRSEFDSIPRDQEHSIFGFADGHLLYEERMRDYFDQKEDGERINKAQRILREFLKSAFNEKHLSPYYALLLADGDNMGKAIDAGKTPDKHKAISKALSEFAVEVKKIVNEQNEGSLFYAGGDDVLALVPLHTVLNCAKQLNEIFEEKLKDFKYDDDKSPTLSVGIAVAHFLEPLSDALDLARKAEKEAKSVDGKNALAVIVDKRSGTSRIIKGNFDETYQRLRELIELDKSGEVSHQLGYELRDLSNRLEVDAQYLTDEENKQLGEIKQKESARIIERKLSKMGRETILRKLKEGKFKELYNLSAKPNGANLLAEELITAQIFANAEVLAETTKIENREKKNIE